MKGKHRNQVEGKRPLSNDRRVSRMEDFEQQNEAGEKITQVKVKKRVKKEVLAALKEFHGFEPAFIDVVEGLLLKETARVNSEIAKRMKAAG